MNEETDGRKQLRLKSIDRVDRVGKRKWKVQATYVEEDDRPRSDRGRHGVKGHWAVVNGRRTWVEEHEARDPRR